MVLVLSHLVAFPCLVCISLPSTAFPCLDLSCLPTHHLELSKEDLEQIGVDRLSDKSENKKTSAPVSNNETSTSSEDKQKTPETGKGDIPDWERELQEELQVDGNSGVLSKSLSLTLKGFHSFGLHHKSFPDHSRDFAQVEGLARNI